MRAVLYLRRSTDEQADSLDTQRDFATRFGASRGWSVVAEYTDTASGAEWAPGRRPELYRLISDAKAKRFDVIICRDNTRLGRDTLRLPLLLCTLADAGARVIYYATGEEPAVDTPLAQFMAAANAFAGAKERAEISSRTRDALERRARAGLVAGGECFGYRRVRKVDGVHLEIREDEAAIVRRIFADAARGDGIRAIAHRLNAEGIAPPRGGSRGWAPSCVHAILHRERYRGRLEWGATSKGYKAGTKIRTDSPDRVLVVERPELAIISPEQWSAVHERRQRVERVTSRRTGGHAPTGLLSGIARCASCGGPIHITRTKQGGVSVPAYACGYHRDRGSTVCSVSLRRPSAEADRVVVDAVTEAIVRLRGHVVEGLRRALDVQPVEDRSGLVRAAEEAQRRVTRIVRAIAASDDAPEALVRELSSAERRAREARAALAAASAPVVSVDAAREAERIVSSHLGEISTSLQLAPREGREVLLALLDGPITARPIETPLGQRWELRGRLRWQSGTDCVPSGIWSVPLLSAF